MVAKILALAVVVSALAACLVALYLRDRAATEAFSIGLSMPGGSIERPDVPLEHRYGSPHARYDVRPDSLYGISDKARKSWLPAVTGNSPAPRNLQLDNIIDGPPGGRPVSSDTGGTPDASGAAATTGGTPDASGAAATTGGTPDASGAAATTGGTPDAPGEAATTGGTSDASGAATTANTGSGLDAAPTTPGCVFDWPDTDEPLVIGDGAWNFTKYRNAAPCSYEEILPANGVRFGSGGEADYISSCASACAADDSCHGMVLTGGTCAMYSVKKGDRHGFETLADHDLLRKTAVCVDMKNVPATPLGAFGRGSASFSGYEPCAYTVLGFEGAGLVDDNYAAGQETTLEITAGDRTKSCAAMCNAKPDCDGYIVNDGVGDTGAACDLFKQDPAATRKIKKSIGRTTVFTRDVEGVQHALMGGKIKTLSPTQPHAKIWDQYSGGARIEKLARDAYRTDNEDYKLVLHGVDCGDTKKVSLFYNSTVVVVDASQPGVGLPVEVHSFRGVFFAFGSDAMHAPPGLKLEGQEIPTAVGPDASGALVSAQGPLSEDENAGYLCKVVSGALSISWKNKPAVWSNGFVKFTGFVMTADVATRIQSALKLENAIVTQEEPGRFRWSSAAGSEWKNGTSFAVESMQVPDTDPNFFAEPTILIGKGGAANAVSWIYKISIDRQAASKAERQYASIVSKTHPTRCLTFGIDAGVTVGQCAGLDSQMFEVLSDGDGLKLGFKEDDGFCLAEVDGAATSADCAYSKWTKGEPDSGGWFTLTGGGRLLTHQPSDAAAVLAAATGGEGQLWKTQKPSEMSFEAVSLRTAFDDGKCLTADGESYSMLNCNGFPSQSFVLDPGQRGGLRIRGSDKCLRIEGNAVTAADCDDESSAVVAGLSGGEAFTLSRAGAYLGHSETDALAVSGYLNLAEPKSSHTWRAVPLSSVNPAPIDPGFYWMLSGRLALYLTNARFAAEQHTKSASRVWQFSRPVGAGPNQFAITYRDTVESIGVSGDVVAVTANPALWTVTSSPLPGRYWIHQNGKAMFWPAADSQAPSTAAFDPSRLDTTVELRRSQSDYLPPVKEPDNAGDDIEWHARLLDKSGKILMTISVLDSPVFVDQDLDVDKIEFADPEHSAYFWSARGSSGPSVTDATGGRQGPSKQLPSGKFYWAAVVRDGMPILSLRFPDKSNDKQTIWSTDINKVLTIKHRNSKAKATFDYDRIDPYIYDIFVWDAADRDKPESVFDARNRQGPWGEVEFTDKDFIALVSKSTTAKAPVLSIEFEGGEKQELFEEQEREIVELVSKKPATMRLSPNNKQYMFLTWNRASKPTGITDRTGRSALFNTEKVGLRDADYVAFGPLLSFAERNTKKYATITWTGKSGEKQIVEKSGTVNELKHRNTKFSIIIEPGYAAYFWNSHAAPGSATDPDGRQGPYGSADFEASDGFDYVAIVEWHPEDSAIAYLVYDSGNVQKIDHFGLHSSKEMVEPRENHRLIVRPGHHAFYWSISNLPRKTDKFAKQFMGVYGKQMDYMFWQGNEQRSNPWRVQEIGSGQRYVMISNDAGALFDNPGVGWSQGQKR